MYGFSSGPIVVHVDGSAESLHAVRWAAIEAVNRHREIRLVHVAEEIGVSYPWPSPTVEQIEAVRYERGMRLLHRVRDVVRDVAPELVPTLVESREGLSSSLRTESEAASLLVLGAPNVGRWERVCASEASLAVAAHARCPVALIRSHVAADEPPTEGPIVVGVDSSPASEEAVALAFEEASLRRTGVIALHCWNDSFLGMVFDEMRWSLDLDAIEKSEQELAEERLAVWRAEYRDVPVECRVERGKPAERLLDIADDAQLMVVGSSSHGGFIGTLLGSTSQAVMSYAMCPVLIARRPDEV